MDTERRAAADDHVDDRQDEAFLDSVKNGILILASMFAAFCFDAALNPPGGLRQDQLSKNVTTITDVGKVPAFKVPFLDKKSPITYLLRAIQGPRPKMSLNFSASELYGPAKALNLELALHDFACFLYYDAVCFMASIVTIVIVMLTSRFRFLGSLIIIVMTMLILLSAISLFFSVVTLIANQEFADWALKEGTSQLVWILFICALIKFIHSYA